MSNKAMISYAQNFEDVILERAFKGQDKGFYIDVGAWEPILDSVTKHFYDKGWHGINVEPVSAYHAKLQQQRDRDVNLNIALLDKPGTTSLYEFSGTGLSTFEHKYATDHKKQGFEVCEQAVNVSTLETICAEYANDQVIDFLKIDTEGTELQVLQGGDWQRFRPRVVLLEATIPLSQETSHAEWEPFLQQRGYIFAYLDGLNRFYVREEEPDLLRCFGIPPNVFDSFVTYRTSQAEKSVDELETRLRSAMRKADKFDKFCRTLLGRILCRII